MGWCAGDKLVVAQGPELQLQVYGVDGIQSLVAASDTAVVAVTKHSQIQLP